MTAYLIRRLSWGAGVILTVGICGFLLTFVAPTDPARAVAGRNATAANVQRIREALHLDLPPLEQLANYLGGLLRGDFGTSYQHGGMPVLDIILARMPATIELAFVGLLLGLAIGLPFGVWSAERRGGVLDRSTAAIGSVFLAIPSFLVGYVLIYVLAFLPVMEGGGSVFPMPSTGGSWNPFDLAALALPAITLALAVAPFYVRIARTLMLDELRQQHIRTARAKGLSERTVVWRHAFRNAGPTLITQVGMDLGFLLGGVIVVEYVFRWPGIGYQAVGAITSEDLPVMMGTLMLGTLLIVVANIVADVIAAMLDPRVELLAAES